VTSTHPVAVLGAGVAGLVAAYELEERGHRVVVLEGSRRIGGRIYTHRFGSGTGAPYAELGAMRIPADHLLTRRYIEKLGLGALLRPFRAVLSDENNYLRVDDGFVRVRQAAPRLVARLRAQLGDPAYRPDTLLFGAWLSIMVEAMGPRELRDGLRADLDAVLRAADRLDLTPFRYGDRGDRIDLVAIFHGYPQLRSACGSRLDTFLDDIAREASAGQSCLHGGMSQLTDRLAGMVRGPVRTGCEVVALEAGPDEVVVHVDDGTGRQAARYPVVLCTLPFSVLRELPVTGIDDDKRDVVKTLDYGGATKIALHCREAFWVRHGLTGGGSATGGRTRQVYYPSLDGQPTSGAALLASYAIAEDAALLGALPEPVRHAAAIDELALLHPELKQAGMVLDAASMAWDTNRWSNGCTARRWGKNATECAEEIERAARPQHRLFFAGEHCSSMPAWLNGAIESALGAVAAIDSFLRDQRGVRPPDDQRSAV
jgi:monoamine oxidase